MGKFAPIGGAAEECRGSALGMHTNPLARLMAELASGLSKHIKLN
jgi:hypothetical protein